MYLGNLPTHSVGSTWRDLEVVGNHVYIVSEASGHGMQVFDLTRLRGVEEPKNWTEDAHLGGFGRRTRSRPTRSPRSCTSTAPPAASRSARTAAADRSWSTSATVSTRSLAGCNGQDGYTHDMQCAIYHGPDTAHQGKEICLGSNEDTLTITDVTDKAHPDQLSRTGYATAAYVHQGWFTKNHKYFLSNDELDEAGGEVDTTTTYMWDLRDLDNPVMMGGFEHGTQSIDHQLFIKNNIATESNYMSGVRVLGTEKLSQGQAEEARLLRPLPEPGRRRLRRYVGELPVLRLRHRDRHGHGGGALHPQADRQGRPASCALRSPATCNAWPAGARTSEHLRASAVRERSGLRPARGIDDHQH